MAYIQGGGKITSLAQVPGTKPTFTVYGLDGNPVSGYVMPELASLSLKQMSSTVRTENYQGEIVAVHSTGQFYECSFRLIPFGTTVAFAKTSALILGPMYTVAIAGLPIISASPFTDVLNVTTGDPGGNRWIYEDGDSVDLSNNQDGTKAITLRRYPKIVGGAALQS